MHINYLVFADTTKRHRGAQNHRVKEQKEDLWNKTKGRDKVITRLKLYIMCTRSSVMYVITALKSVSIQEPDKCPAIIQSKSVSGMCLCCTTPTPWWWSCRVIKLTTQVLGGHAWIDLTLEWLLSGSWGPCESMHGLCAPRALITSLFGWLVRFVAGSWRSTADWFMWEKNIVPTKIYDRLRQATAKRTGWTWIDFHCYYNVLLDT